jgi:AraC-like DNA-binding protein
MRSFRTWYRFRAAAEAFRTGGHMTSAAHAAGFYDSAHFARAFRQSFGLPPSSVLTPDLEIRLVGDNESLVARQADQ